MQQNRTDIEQNTLIVVSGPTGSGKTALAIEIAERLGCDIISADSRQIYRDIPVVTAAPTAEELSRVHHHFVGTLPLDAYYSAADYEGAVMQLLPQLWSRGPYVVMCGGSMMYIDAVLRGLDPLPTIPEEVRTMVIETYCEHGLSYMQQWLERLDPESVATVDMANQRRVLHAIELCIASGTKASTLRTGNVKERPWRTVMLAINHKRQELFDRINTRVEQMDRIGLEEEARAVYPMRHLNSLNTVGLKEMFAYFDGTMDRATAMARIAKNTRVYAKKQLLWLSKQPMVHLLDPTRPLLDQAMHIIENERKRD